MPLPTSISSAGAQQEMRPVKCGGFPVVQRSPFVLGQICHNTFAKYCLSSYSLTNCCHWFFVWLSFVNRVFCCQFTVEIVCAVRPDHSRCTSKACGSKRMVGLDVIDLTLTTEYVQSVRVLIVGDSDQPFCLAM